MFLADHGGVKTKKLNQKGSVSIYLVLTFAVLLSFILMIVEGTREEAMKLKIECAMDLSLYSVFAEYNRELLNQYDLFFIDTSYGQSGASVDNTAEHLKEYMNENFQVSGVNGITKDLLGLSASEAMVTDFSLASDEGAMVLKRQAVSYMKDLYGGDILDDLEDQLTTVEEKGLLTTDVSSMQQDNQRAIDSFELPKKKVSSDKWVDQKLDNPADPVNHSRGVLALILPSSQELSQVSINPSNYISNRNINSGSGVGNRKGIRGADELIFQEYIIKKSGCYTKRKENSELQYELEYILKGRNSDLENLKAVVNELLFMRQASNAAYLFSDGAKIAEAEALALTATSIFGLPELTEIVKYSILYAWVYAESVYDIRVLLAGGKIPLVKTNESWHYSLAEMFLFAGDKNVPAIEEPGGIAYVDYLRILLTMESEKNRTFRFLDVIEMDIRKTKGNSHFRLDTCVDYITANVSTNSTYGKNHSIERTYYYE